MCRPKEEPKHSCDDSEEAPRDFASLRGHVRPARKPLVRENARSACLWRKLPLYHLRYAWSLIRENIDAAALSNLSYALRAFLCKAPSLSPNRAAQFSLGIAPTRQIRIKQRMETRAVVCFPQVTQLMHHNVFQALGRLGGELHVYTNAPRFHIAAAPAAHHVSIC